MTGVTTQQPVAWQNSIKPCEIYADDDLELVWKQCPTFLPLYTTDQAEAYAAAKVCEALEEAADIANEWAMKYVEVDTAHVKVGFYILDEMKLAE